MILYQQTSIKYFWPGLDLNTNNLYVISKAYRSWKGQIYLEYFQWNLNIVYIEFHAVR